MREIKIDFDNPGLPQRLDVVENDAQSRFFKAVLYKDGKAYAAPSGATYSIMYRGFGPQNEGWYDTINDGAGKRAACSVSGNVVTCEIARQALRVPGHVSVVLCVTGSNGYMLHGWPIDCNCRNDNYTGGTSVESFFYITQVTNADWTSAIQTWEELKNMIDPTLSLSGKAADAKATGDAVGEIKEDLVNVKEIFNGNYQYLKSSEAIHGYYGIVNNKITHKTDTTGYVVFPKIKLKANVTYSYNNVFGKMSFICDESGSLIRKLYDDGDDNVTSSIKVSTDSYLYLTVRTDKVGIAMLYDGNQPSNYIEGYYDSLSIPSLRLNGNQLNRNFNLLDTYRSIVAKNGAIMDSDRIVLKAGNTCMGSKVFFTGLLPENLKGKKLTLNVEVAYDGYIYKPFIPTLNVNCIGVDGITHYSVGREGLIKFDNGIAYIPVELDVDYGITYIEVYMNVGFDYSSTGVDSAFKINDCYVTIELNNFDAYGSVENDTVILDNLDNITGYKLHINRENSYILHIDNIKTTSFYETNKNISFCNMKTGHITNEIVDVGTYLMLFDNDDSNDFMFVKYVSDYDVLEGRLIRSEKKYVKYENKKYTRKENKSLLFSLSDTSFRPFAILGDYVYAHKHSKTIYRSLKSENNFVEFCNVGSNIENAIMFENGNIAYVSSEDYYLHTFIGNVDTITDFKFYDDVNKYELLPHGSFSLKADENVGVISEYRSNKYPTSGYKGYISFDYGATWTQCIDISTFMQGSGYHLHCIRYDKYEDLIIACIGDGKDNQSLYFSKDRGNTWQKLVNILANQATEIIPMKDCVLFCSDSRLCCTYRIKRPLTELVNKDICIDTLRIYARRWGKENSTEVPIASVGYTNGDISIFGFMVGTTAMDGIDGESLKHGNIFVSNGSAISGYFNQTNRCGVARIVGDQKGNVMAYFTNGTYIVDTI